MPQAVYILFGASFTIAASIAAGRLLLRRLGLGFRRAEETFFAFLAGSACLSLAVFALASAHLVHKGVLLAIGVAVIALAVRRGSLENREPGGSKHQAPTLLPAGVLEHQAAGSHTARGERFPALPRLWHYLFGTVFLFFFVLYFTNAMAPERSPDGSSYHLGLVARYARERGFPSITTNMYANLSQGVEMLFLNAYVFGRHSAAALVHLAFLLAMPLGMLSYGKRFGFPVAGAAGALFFFASPVIGVDGISAYNDVAVAAILFGVFYLLQIWDRERNPALLVPIGLLAGFAFAAKYTAFLAVPYALGFLAWKLHRRRRPVLRPLVIVSALALLMIAPWLVKNWIVVHNPVSPFFNQLFPNPYVYPSFEEDYARSMRHYPGLNSHWEIPLEVTLRGRVLRGLLGPLFLLSPLALAALRWPAGRQLLLAAAVFGVPFAANIGTRFLIPPAPYLSLAMAMVFTRVKFVAPALVVAHAVLSWPGSILWYADRHCWRMERWQPKQAFRIESEESWLNFKMPAYSIARLVELLVPAGEKVLSFASAAESYTTREILVSYQSAEGLRLRDALWTPLVPDSQPTLHHTFRFPSARLRRVRVMQTAGGTPDLWSVTEMRVFSGDHELPRAPQWQPRAHPNPWDVQLAFDNSPVTRWRSWRRLFPGMFLEIDFGRPETADRVLLECSRDQYGVRLKLEGQLESGEWRTLSEAPETTGAPAPPGLRRAATRALKVLGVSYLLVHDSDFGAGDFRLRATAWGIRFLGERGEGKLYRVE